MKRDMELVRQILLQIERQSSYGSQIDLRSDDYSLEEINYHVILMDEAGLIQAEELKNSRPGYWKPTRLTWHGHEFLEASKDDIRWNKTKQIMDKMGGFVFKIAEQMLIDLLKKQIQDSSY